MKMLVFQLCLTLCNPRDCSPPGSSVHAILQARILEWVAIPFSRGSSQPRDQTLVSYIGDRFFTIWATREAPRFFLSFQRLVYADTQCVCLFPFSIHIVYHMVHATYPLFHRFILLYSNDVLKINPSMYLWDYIGSLLLSGFVYFVICVLWKAFLTVCCCCFNGLVLVFGQHE